MAKKSLHTEIIEALREQLKDSKTNAHYNWGVLKNPRGAAYYAISNCIAIANQIKETRYWASVEAGKKKRRKNRVVDNSRKICPYCDRSLKKPVIGDSEEEAKILRSHVKKFHKSKFKKDNWKNH